METLPRREDLVSVFPGILELRLARLDSNSNSHLTSAASEAFRIGGRDMGAVEVLAHLWKHMYISTGLTSHSIRFLGADLL